MNLHKIRNIDLEKIIETTDISSLQSVLEMVTFAELSVEEVKLSNPESLYSLFAIMQLTIEYLLNIQDKLALELNTLASDREDSTSKSRQNEYRLSTSLNSNDEVSNKSPREHHESRTSSSNDDSKNLSNMEEILIKTNQHFESLIMFLRGEIEKGHRREDELRQELRRFRSVICSNRKANNEFDDCSPQEVEAANALLILRKNTVNKNVDTIESNSLAGYTIFDDQYIRNQSMNVEVNDSFDSRPSSNKVDKNDGIPCSESLSQREQNWTLSSTDTVDSFEAIWNASEETPSVRKWRTCSEENISEEDSMLNNVHSDPHTKGLIECRDDNCSISTKQKDDKVKQGTTNLFKRAWKYGKKPIISTGFTSGWRRLRSHHRNDFSR